MVLLRFVAIWSLAVAGGVVGVPLENSAPTPQRRGDLNIPDTTGTAKRLEARKSTIFTTAPHDPHAELNRMHREEQGELQPEDAQTQPNTPLPLQPQALDLNALDDRLGRQTRQREFPSSPGRHTERTQGQPPASSAGSSAGTPGAGGRATAAGRGGH